MNTIKNAWHKSKGFDQELADETKDKRRVTYVLVQYYDDFNKTTKMIGSSDDINELIDQFRQAVIDYYDGSSSKKIFLTGILMTVMIKNKIHIPSYESIPYFVNTFAGIFMARHGISMYGEENLIGQKIVQKIQLINQIRSRQNYLGSLDRSSLTSYLHQNCPYLNAKKMNQLSKRNVVAKILKVEIRSIIIDTKYVQNNLIN